MTTKLTLYNGALRMLGQRKLASLTENRLSRRTLDDIWDEGAIDACLEQGLWKFATRSIELDYNPSEEPDFGYPRVFNQPDDFIRTVAVCQDAYFKIPNEDYQQEASLFFASVDVLYVRYVSNDSSYGGDYSLWPVSFVNYVQSYMAYMACDALTQGTTKKQELERTMRMYLIDARSKAAMEEPTKNIPDGRWVQARRGIRWGSRRDTY